MVVKSATKKKLMDLGIEENFAHALADDRKWDDVKVMTQADIAKICETDSRQQETSTAPSSPPPKRVATTAKAPVRSPKSVSQDGRPSDARAKTVVDLESYDYDRKMQAMENELANDPVYQKLEEAVEATDRRFTNRILADLTVACHKSW